MANPTLTPPGLPLRDIHLPAAIGWWPLAPGWWGLLALVLLLALGFWLLLRFRRRRRLRRLALTQLDRLQVLEGNQLAAALSRLLRQAALGHFPRHQVAGLTGEAWLQFLDRPFSDQPFQSGVGRCLVEAPYRSDSPVAGPDLINLGRRWLKQLPPQPPGAGRGR